MQVSFKNCAPFTKCITKIDGTTIDDAEDLDSVMPMYNFTEYNSDCSEKTEILCFILIMKQLILIIILKILKTLNLSSIRFFFFLIFLGNAVTQPAPNNTNGILKNVTIALPLNY